MLFLSQGYDKTSMDSVASEASVSKQTLYSHFANKEQLFRACITGKVETYGLNLQWARREDSVEDTLTRFGVQLMELFEDPNVIAMYRLLMAESENHPELCHAFYEAGPEATKQKLADYFEDQASLGKLVAHDPPDSAELLVSILEPNLISRLLLGTADSPKRDADEPYVRKRVRWFLRSHAAPD